MAERALRSRCRAERPLRSAAVLRLLTFLSPTFPVGSFSYSHGLEALIEDGELADADQLGNWLRDLLEVGSGWNDAVLFTGAYRAAASCHWEGLLAVAELGQALAASRERQLETLAQGRAFLAAAEAAWPCEAGAKLEMAGGAPYPVTVAAVMAGQGVPLGAALPGFLHAFSANLVSVGVRLVPLGQSAGLRVLARLHPVIGAVAARGEGASLDNLGSATMLSEVAAMRHEEQYSRVFRT